MSLSGNKKSVTKPVNGLLFLIPAYLIWGGSPIFWKALAHVSAFELLLQRTVWSFLFFLVMVVLQNRTEELIQAIKKRSIILTLVVTTLLLSTNWYLFIWAVNHDQILQTSLGYYINPLIMVLLGMIFLKERLRPLQIIALIIAGSGVIYYALTLGQYPWIALTIAFSFGFYSLLHKMTSVASLTGLCIETMMLSIPALPYLVWLYLTGAGAMFHIGSGTDLLLVGTTLVTALPLLLFTLGARRSLLSTVGFTQYIAPSCTFILALFFYKEPFALEKLVTFLAIWVALILYSADSLYAYKKIRASMEKIN